MSGPKEKIAGFVLSRLDIRTRLFSLGLIPRSLLRPGRNVGACLQAMWSARQRTNWGIACKQAPTKSNAVGGHAGIDQMPRGSLLKFVYQADAKQWKAGRSGPLRRERGITFSAHRADAPYPSGQCAISIRHCGGKIPAVSSVLRKRFGDNFFSVCLANNGTRLVAVGVVFACQSRLTCQPI
jgi:hypothetical protein